jgi:hypothetical protein
MNLNKDLLQHVFYCGVKGSFGSWIQPVNATDWAKRSAGV